MFYYVTLCVSFVANRIVLIVICFWKVIEKVRSDDDNELNHTHSVIRAKFQADKYSVK